MTKDAPSFDTFLKSGEFPTYKDAVIAHAAALAIEDAAESTEVSA